MFGSHERPITYQCGISQLASAAVLFKAVVLLLLIHCLLLLQLFCYTFLSFLVLQSSCWGRDSWLYEDKSLALRALDLISFTTALETVNYTTILCCSWSIFKIKCKKKLLKYCALKLLFNRHVVLFRCYNYINSIYMKLYCIVVALTVYVALFWCYKYMNCILVLVWCYNLYFYCDVIIIVLLHEMYKIHNHWE